MSLPVIHTSVRVPEESPPPEAPPVEPMSFWPVFASFLALIMGGYCLTQLSPTIDEWGYIQYGVKYWYGGSQNWLVEVGVLPQLFWFQNAPGALYLWMMQGGIPGGTSGDFGVSLSLDDQFHVLWLARATNLMVSGLGTIWGVWALTDRIFGRVAANIASIFAAVEPNLLAGYILATSDAPILPFCLFSMLLYLNQLQSPRFWRLIAIALLFGLGTSCKISMLPIGLCGLFACWLSVTLRKRLSRPSFLSWVGVSLKDGVVFGFQSSVIVLVGFLVAWASSGFRQGNLLEPDNPNLVAYKIAEKLGRHGDDAKTWVQSLQKTRVPAPISVLRYQVAHSIGGHPMTFRGVSASHGPWYYYPYVFAMKTNIVVLIIAGLSLFHREVRRSPVFLGTLLVMVVAMRSKVQAGPRYYLLMYTFACSMCGAGLAWLIARKSGGWSNLALAAVITAASFFVTVPSMPELLPHTSPIWGGDYEGYRYADANYDWGQGLYQAFNAADRLALKRASFIATGDPNYGVSERHTVIKGSDEATILKQMKKRLVVISVYALFHSELSNPELRDIRRALLRIGPTGRLTVTSFYFDLRTPEQIARFEKELASVKKAEKAPE